MADTEFQTISDEALSPRGMALLGYQRTKHISRAAQKAWAAGDAAPLIAETSANRRAIFEAILSEIKADYAHISQVLATTEITPKSIIDIGCGQALGDLFFLLEFDPAIILVDIEETSEQYHFWAESGAGYASLAEATALLRQNGARQVRAINPRKDTELLAGLHADLVISTISCGFHYPVTPYMEIFQRTLEKGGALILDLRRSYADEPDKALETLFEMSLLTEIPCSEPKSARLLFTHA